GPTTGKRAVPRPPTPGRAPTANAPTASSAAETTSRRMPKPHPSGYSVTASARPRKRCRPRTDPRTGLASQPVGYEESDRGRAAMTRVLWIAIVGIALALLASSASAIARPGQHHRYAPRRSRLDAGPMMATRHGRIAGNRRTHVYYRTASRLRAPRNPV